MKEKLTCSQCGKNWRREKTRGRKPHTCPKCTLASVKPQPKKTVVQLTEVKTTRVKKRIIQVEPVAQVTSSNASSDQNDLSVGKVYQYYHPLPPDAEELRESTKKGSTWRCTRCKYEFKVPVSISAPPTHKCSENSKSNPCERID